MKRGLPSKLLEEGWPEPLLCRQGLCKAGKSWCSLSHITSLSFPQSFLMHCLIWGSIHPKDEAAHGQNPSRTSQWRPPQRRTSPQSFHLLPEDSHRLHRTPEMRKCYLIEDNWWLGRGPKSKNGQIKKILRIQLGLYIRKPGKKIWPKKSWFWLGGLHLKNSARAQRMLKENLIKIFKKHKMAKNDFSRSDLGS